MTLVVSRITFKPLIFLCKFFINIYFNFHSFLFTDCPCPWVAVGSWFQPSNHLNSSFMELISSTSKSHIPLFLPGTISVSHLLTSISPVSQCKKKKKKGYFSVLLHLSSTTDPPKERRKYFITIKHYTHTKHGYYSCFNYVENS